VAIKLAQVQPISPSNELTPSKARPSLLTEYALAGAFDHRGLIVLHEAGEINGWEYIVMEAIEGMSLAHLIQRSGPLPVSVCLDIMRQLCEALSVLHSDGVAGGRGAILHLDLKPSNVMVSETGEVKLIDFGVSQRLDEEQNRTVVYGTPAYMAPEQVRRGECGRETDLFSAGAILFEMLTGQRLFPSREVAVLIAQRREGDAGRSDKSTGCDSLDQLIKQCTAFEPKERFQTASEVLQALADL